MQRAAFHKIVLSLPAEKQVMRVLIINTSQKTGGAALAANRLKDALNNNGVEARMLVRDKTVDDSTVIELPRTLKTKWSKLWERWCIFYKLNFSRRHLFELDIANVGTDITKLIEFREADLIHLSWINQGMLSIGGIRRILESGKPVVWTMHDLWPASSICHYAHGCEGFMNRCGNCMLLPGGGHANDLSEVVWRRKKKALDGNQISFVTCSKWLGEQARQSSLLKGQTVTSIPNPIDTEVFKPQNKLMARKMLGLPEKNKIILFVSQRVTDKRKGIDYFIKAIGQLVARHPEMKQNITIAILGSDAEQLAEQLALPTHLLGYVSDIRQIINVYNAADVFVLPSLEDNLPNTIMEAMACGVPCVGFEVGGIPEMIDHRVNGYVARERDTNDLAQGMDWVLNEANYAELSREALQKVHRNYSQQSVAKQYIEVYYQAITKKNKSK